MQSKVIFDGIFCWVFFLFVLLFCCCLLFDLLFVIVACVFVCMCVVKFEKCECVRSCVCKSLLWQSSI